MPKFRKLFCDKHSTPTVPMSGRMRCLVCTREGKAAWAEANKERLRAKRLLWVANNREAMKAYSLKWARNNKDKCRLSSARWNKNNGVKLSHIRKSWKERTGKGVAYRMAYIARHKNALVGCPLIDEFVAFIRRTRPPCYYCGAPATTHDHLIPLSRGGKHEIENVEPACRTHNSSKGARTVPEYLARIDYVPVFNAAAKQDFFKGLLCRQL